MRKLLVLAIVFAGLAAFVYFYEIAGKEERDKARELEESLLRLEREAINEVIVSPAGKDQLRFEKVGDQWVLREPLDTVADKTNVDSLVRNLANAKRERTFNDVKEEDLAAYGLQEPTFRIRVKAGDIEKTLLLGKKDYSGNNVYVRVEGEPEVHLTSSFLLTAADKELNDWRSKDVFVFDRDKVEEIEIRRGGETVRLVKEGDAWKLRDPVEDQADQTKINSLLGTLEFARIQDFVAETPESLQEYGLDEPKVSVRLRLAGSDTWMQLDLGKESGENFYARDPQRKPVFTVRKDVYEDLTQDVLAFRDKDVVNVKQDDVARIELLRGDQRLVVRHEEFRWLMEEPEEFKDKEVPAYKFWYPLDDMRFEALDGDFGANREAEVEVVVHLKDGDERRFRFWKQGEEAWAQRVADGRAGKISLEDYKKLEIEPKDLTEN
ncbi:MAG: hypothetical protein Kow00109_17190 [Acidobacteriota bacterium]